MNYDVTLSLEAVEDVLRITMDGASKNAIVEASNRIRAALERDPHGEGEHLSEGLFYIDREPLRAFFTIDDREMQVEVVNVKAV